jgi:hypothetical protein
VDKGYSGVLVDSDGEHHGPELGELLRRRCDTLKERDARRATPTGRNKRGADANRWWAAWTTGITAQALTTVSGRERFCGAAG